VRFGTLLKSVSGLELGGVASHPPGRGLPFVAAGTRLRVGIPFCARLLPGTYFVNAGLVGIVEGGEQFLHRRLDAAIFRVSPETELRASELVDFSSDGPARIEVLKSDAGRSA
jgi:lipopolysaccharide transport system ATP-binding protein